MSRGVSIKSFSVMVMCATLGACSSKPEPATGPPAQGPSAYRGSVLSDRPSGYWRLDETRGARAYDQSEAASHGTIEGAVALQQPGATPGDGDTAMAFKGQGRIFVPHSASLELKSGTVTLEAWVKTTTVQSGLVPVLCKGTTGVQTEYCLVLIDGVPAYQSVVESYSSKSETVPLGTWTHIAVTVVNNATGTLYVNGNVAGTFASTANHIVTSSTQPLVIGAEAGSKSGWFVGAIDEPAVYDHALTPEQIAKHTQAATVKSAGTSVPSFLSTAIAFLRLPDPRGR